MADFRNNSKQSLEIRSDWLGKLGVEIVIIISSFPKLCLVLMTLALLVVCLGQLIFELLRIPVRRTQLMSYNQNSESQTYLSSLIYTSLIMSFKKQENIKYNGRSQFHMELCRFDSHQIVFEILIK